MVFSQSESVLSVEAELLERRSKLKIVLEAEAFSSFFSFLVKGMLGIFSSLTVGLLALQQQSLSSALKFFSREIFLY